MERRLFLRTGLAAGLIGVTGRPPFPSLPPSHRPRVRPRSAEPVKLSSNENPLGIAPAARQAVVESLDLANRYPTRRADIAAAIAAKHDVPPDMVVLGAGSTEVIKMAVDTFVPPGGRIVVPSPTYEDTSWYAGATELDVVAVPITAAGAHDLDGMRAAVAAGGGRAFVYVCNPNNPTGTLTPCGDVDAWIRDASADVTFLVDEAYFDFADDPTYHTAMRWVADHPNVIVARTFSKVYGMAGLRLGYGIAHASTAKAMQRRNVRNNVNQAALAAGLASVEQHDFVAQSLAANREAKAVLCRCLDELGLDYFPSHTNFVMHRIGSDLEPYRARMREAGFLVGRPFPPYTDRSRVSLGLPDDMRRFADTLRAFREKGWV